jgi:hypothetical protein
MKKLFIALLFIFINVSLVHAQDPVVYINSVDVTIENLITDNGSGMGTGATMQFSVDDGVSWSTEEQFTDTKQLTLLDLVEGSTTCILALFCDVARNCTLQTTPFVACASVDMNSPVGKIKVKNINQ